MRRINRARFALRALKIGLLVGASGLAFGLGGGPSLHQAQAARGYMESFGAAGCSAGQCAGLAIFGSTVPTGASLDERSPGGDSGPDARSGGNNGAVGAAGASTGGAQTGAGDAAGGDTGSDGTGGGEVAGGATGGDAAASSQPAGDDSGNTGDGSTGRCGCQSQ